MSSSSSTSSPFSIEFADRIQKLPPYLFARIDEIKAQETKKGRKLTTLGIGDPDLPTPPFVIDRLAAASKKPINHQYPSYKGMAEFRNAAAKWFAGRFDVKVDPETEVVALIGSKEGIAHFPFAFINPGEAALVPDPAYPVYATATEFAGGIPLKFRLKAENGFLPDFAELERLVQSGPRVKMIFLNYPNNPTGATATLEFFEKLVVFAKKHQIIVAHDNAYSELYFDGVRPPSFLQVPGAKDVGIEFHSFSKTFNMTGWRVGFAVGNPKIIRGLLEVKSNTDSGAFNACQEAAIAALENSEPFCTELRAIYQKRRDVLLPALKAVGLKCSPLQATFYVWAAIPEGVSSEDFVMKLIREKGIVSTPGSGFGLGGEGFVRFTLCADIEILKQVAEALKGSVN